MGKLFRFQPENPLSISVISSGLPKRCLVCSNLTDSAEKSFHDIQNFLPSLTINKILNFQLFDSPRKTVSDILPYYDSFLAIPKTSFRYLAKTLSTLSQNFLKICLYVSLKLKISSIQLSSLRLEDLKLVEKNGFPKFYFLRTDSPLVIFIFLLVLSFYGLKPSYLIMEISVFPRWLVKLIPGALNLTASNKSCSNSILLDLKLDQRDFLICSNNPETFRFVLKQFSNPDNCDVSCFPERILFPVSYSYGSSVDHSNEYIRLIIGSSISIKKMMDLRVLKRSPNQLDISEFVVQHTFQDLYNLKPLTIESMLLYSLLTLGGIASFSRLTKKLDEDIAYLLDQRGQLMYFDYYGLKRCLEYKDVIENLTSRRLIEFHDNQLSINGLNFHKISVMVKPVLEKHFQTCFLALTLLCSIPSNNDLIFLQQSEHLFLFDFNAIEDIFSECLNLFRPIWFPKPCSDIYEIFHNVVNDFVCLGIIKMKRKPRLPSSFDCNSDSDQEDNSEIIEFSSSKISEALHFCRAYHPYLDAAYTILLKLLKMKEGYFKIDDLIDDPSKKGTSIELDVAKCIAAHLEAKGLIEKSQTLFKVKGTVENITNCLYWIFKSQDVFLYYR